MEPKQKAIELIKKYWQLLDGINASKVDFSSCKACAAIAVDEIIDATLSLREAFWWREVKKEIYNIQESDL